jgi:beta-lactamase class D
MNVAALLFFTLVSAVDPAGQELFTARGVDGTFLLLDVKDNRLTVTNPAQADRGYLPFSTFKIPNTLIGLAAGVIPDEKFALKWDGKKKARPEWERDHDLASAMKNSVVWFYQEVARRIGRKRMQAGVDSFDYGNHDLSGSIDRFWLDGKLRITPRQQLEFLRRLSAGELPVKPEHLAILQKIIVLDESGGAVWRGKTGTGWQDGKPIAWLVGTVQKDERRFIYVTLVLPKENHGPDTVAFRKELTRALLVKYGALPNP